MVTVLAPLADKSAFDATLAPLRRPLEVGV